MRRYTPRMLLLSSIAMAAPLAPIVDSQPAGSFSVLMAGSTRTDHSQQRGCETGQCLALVVDNGGRAVVEYRPLSFLSVWGELGWSLETVRAASYDGDGLLFGGGLKAGIPIRPWLAVDLWGSYVNWTTSEEDKQDDHRRSELDVGAAVRFGSSTEGLVGWVGPVITPWAQSELSALDGSVPLSLMPRFPVSAMAGMSLVSEPLGPVWAERGRLTFGAGFTLGNRIGGDCWLGFLW